MRTLVNNSSKEGVVSSIESVHDCVRSAETKFVSFAEKRVAVTRPGWAAVQYLCQTPIHDVINTYQKSNGHNNNDNKIVKKLQLTLNLASLPKFYLPYFTRKK